MLTGLFNTMAPARVESNVRSYSAAISACEKGAEWDLALGLLRIMAEGEVESEAEMVL